MMMTGRWWPDSRTPDSTPVVKAQTERERERITEQVSTRKKPRALHGHCLTFRSI